LTTTTYAVGFDPYLGFYHRPRFGRPALALDLAEEFRPLIAESVVVNLINNGEVGRDDFVIRAGGVALTPDGRRTVLRAYERRLAAQLQHPTFGYRASYRRTLEIQARLLGAHLLGEVPEYVPVTTTSPPCVAATSSPTTSGTRSGCVGCTTSSAATGPACSTRSSCAT